MGRFRVNSLSSGWALLQGCQPLGRMILQIPTCRLHNNPLLDMVRKMEQSK